MSGGGCRLLVLLMLGSCWTLIGALRLPEYVKPCSRHDPKLNECALRHAKEAIPKFIHGDKRYNVPSLDPLFIPHMLIQQDSYSRAVGIRMDIINSTLYGLTNVTIDDIRIDLNKKRMDFAFTVPKIEVRSKYSVNGRILILPIVGNGNANITMTQLKANYSFDFELKKKSDGNYVVPVNPQFDLKVAGRFHMHLSNLFNGEPLLGKQMNIFINENWREVLDDVGPAVAEAINQITTQILLAIFSLVPYEEAFPETVP